MRKIKLNFKIDDEYAQKLTLFDNKSEVIRMFVIAGLDRCCPPSSQELEELKTISFELHKIGLNLNQLVIKLYQTKHIVVDEIRTVLNDVNATQSTLKTISARFYGN